MDQVEYMSLGAGTNVQHVKTGDRPYLRQEHGAYCSDLWVKKVNVNDGKHHDNEHDAHRSNEHCEQENSLGFTGQGM